MKIDLSDRNYTFGYFDSSYTFPGISVTKKRSVTCYEIELYIENGGMTYVNDSPYPIRRGYILVVKPGAVRYSELPLKTDYVKISAEVNWVCDILDGVEMYFSVPDIDHGNALVQSMMEARQNGDELLQHSALFSFLSWIKNASERASRFKEIRKQKSREDISLAIEFIETHFREKCTLEEISAYAHLSPVYFHGLFKKAIGKTPYEYLTRLRVEEAKRHLLSGSMSMSEISEYCGFSSQSYFNHSFKHCVGVTPREYKRKLLAEYFSENGIFHEKEQEETENG